MSKSLLLKLCWVDSKESWQNGSGSIVINQVAGPIQRVVEAAGKPYQDLMNRLHGFATEENKSNDDDEKETEAESSKQYEHKRHKRVINKNTEDPYELLGLGHLRFRATEDDIKSAYKKMAIKYHPDKLKGNQSDDELFKKISGAYEMLSDKNKRIAHDSQQDFDDSIPTGRETGDFFDIYEPVFDRFGMWSVEKDVPSLGDINTPYSEVEKFYKFWFSFKSWRDFSFEDEFDVREAESREEKRWMERQNERERRKKKKEETQKIFKLTEMAEMKDPRIKKFKDEQKEQKRKFKEAKMEGHRKKQEELERIVAMEKAKKEEEEKKRAEELAIQKKQKDKEKEKLRKIRSKVRNLSTPFAPGPEDLEMVCIRLSYEQLQELVKSLDTQNVESAKSAFYDRANQLKKEDEEKKRKLAQEKEDSKESSKPWTEDELALLSQAVARFPGGAVDRWQQIYDYMGGTRSVKEIIGKTKETKFVAQKPVVSDAYERFVKTKKKPEREISAEASKPTDDPTATTTTTTTTTPAKKTVDPADWSKEEQKALEKALATYPSSLSDRWDKISEAVQGRSKKECIARYKYLVALIKEKKSESGPS